VTEEIRTLYEECFEEFWDKYRKKQSANVDDFKAVIEIAFNAGYFARREHES
jgi:myosin-crossreactive antigen